MQQQTTSSSEPAKQLRELQYKLSMLIRRRHSKFVRPPHLSPVPSSGVQLLCTTSVEPCVMCWQVPVSPQLQRLDCD